MNSPKVAHHRELVGAVVSNKMSRTLVVRVERRRAHPVYKKYYRISRKYKVHDARGGYEVGDVVRFVECRPISKDKRWRVVSRVK